MATLYFTKMSIKYLFIDCLKAHYKTFSKIGEEHTVNGKNLTYPNCTMPWKQSMLGHHVLPATSDEDAVGCNKTDAETLIDLDYWYMKEGARTDHLACSGNIWMHVWLSGPFYIYCLLNLNYTTSFKILMSFTFSSM